MTLKNNRSSLLCHIKLWASFQSHRWIQTGVTARQRSFWENISDFFVPCDLEIWWMTLKNNRAPLLCCFKLCASFHSLRWIETSYSPEHPQFGPKSAIFVLCDLEIWRMTLKNNRTPLLRYFKLCASFRSYDGVEGPPHIFFRHHGISYGWLSNSSVGDNNYCYVIRRTY